MSSSSFNGAAVRLARIFNELALEDVAARVDKTRQYLHRVETGQAVPTPELIERLAAALEVQRAFFFRSSPLGIPEENFHFRRLLSTGVTLKHTAMAKAEVFALLVRYLDEQLKLPDLRIPARAEANTPDDIERAADDCRKEWGIGMGPIPHMIRLAEHVGAIVTTFHGTSKEIDALSVMATRPIIVRNDAKASVCRQRFDIAHELGHAVLHNGVVTGDRVTESQANRFASALLVPRSMMIKLFPRSRTSRLNWSGICEFKLTWKISKAAILYRAHQLELISDAQYRSGFFALKRGGEAITEREDHLIPKEEPELLARSIQFLREKRGIKADSVAFALGVHARFLQEFLGGGEPQERRTADVIELKPQRRAAQ